MEYAMAYVMEYGWAYAMEYGSESLTQLLYEQAAILR
jgi:hypothetical protein